MEAEQQGPKYEQTTLWREVPVRPDRNPRFSATLARMKAIHERKSKDYAEDADPYSNFKFSSLLVKQFADPLDQVFAALIGVKIARLGQLLGLGKVPNHESINDTLIDLATYTTIWASLHGAGEGHAV